jgi:hypothetical protein
MARVKIEYIIDHLSTDMRSALDAAVKKVLPEATFDRYQLFRAFRSAVGRKCSTWEKVPDNYVESE